MKKILSLSIIAIFSSSVASAAPFHFLFNMMGKHGIIYNGQGRSWADGTFAKSCKEYKNPPAGTNKQYEGRTGNGIYTIKPDGNTSFNVLCDMTTGGGGWTNINYSFGNLAAAVTSTNSMIPTSGTPTSEINGPSVSMSNDAGCTEYFQRVNLNSGLMSSLGGSEVKIKAINYVSSGQAACGGAARHVSYSNLVKYNTFDDAQLSACDNTYRSTAYGAGNGWSCYRTANVMEYSFTTSATNIFNMYLACGTANQVAQIFSIMIR